MTEEKLRMIYAAEEYLKKQGFTQVRVRCHAISGGYLARIELEPAEMTRLLDEAAELSQYEEDFREMGFEYVALDLGGYKKGKMNR